MYKVSSFLRQSADTDTIKVEHPGILEVPEGKGFDDLPQSHYISLAKKRGRGAIMRALLNLERWNQEKAPSVSTNARRIINGLKNNKEWQDL